MPTQDDTAAATDGRRPRKLPTRGYAPEATRRAVLDSALTLFERKGFHATSVQEIAERAKVSKGAFYHHFESKEDVLRLIHAEFSDVQLEDIARATAEFASPTDQLREVIRTSVVSTAHYRANVNVFFQERRYLSGKAFSAIKQKRDEAESKLVEIIERGIKAGEFRQGINPRITAFNLIGMIIWSNQWFRPGGELSTDELGDVLAETLLWGIAAKPDRKRSSKGRA